MNKMTIISVIVAVITILVSCQEETKVSVQEDFGITNQIILENIDNGIHLPTGLKAGPGLESVLRHCVSCHSSKLITQNRANKEGWKSMIDWMYETQNLPKLGDQEAIIISYLSEHYSPVSSGRRMNISVENWYNLDQ